jgi:endogenous inhibitor of DNA gyrase (YacG/DUF329 family)
MATAPCPNCGRPVDLATGVERPFCSARCRLIDLGAWLTDGARSIPAEPAPPADASGSTDVDER